jgi:hypothetical protein
MPSNRLQPVPVFAARSNRRPLGLLTKLGLDHGARVPFAVMADTTDLERIALKGYGVQLRPQIVHCQHHHVDDASPALALPPPVACDASFPRDVEPGQQADPPELLCQEIAGDDSALRAIVAPDSFPTGGTLEWGVLSEPVFGHLVTPSVLCRDVPHGRVELASGMVLEPTLLVLALPPLEVLVPDHRVLFAHGAIESTTHLYHLLR